MNGSMTVFNMFIAIADKMAEEKTDTVTVNLKSPQDGRELTYEISLIGYRAENGVTHQLDAEAPDDWIPVADRLPEPLEDVLIVYAGDEGPERDLGFLTRLGQWRLVGLDEYSPTVSHWQPLPALPAELAEATP